MKKERIPKKIVITHTRAIASAKAREEYEEEKNTKERDVFDIIKETQEEIGKDKPLSELNKEDPVTEGNRILFGKDGKPVHMEPGPYEHDVLDGKHRCDQCGDYFDEEEGEWVDNLEKLKIFYCNGDLEKIKGEEMKTRTGEIPMFEGEKP